MNNCPVSIYGLFADGDELPCYVGQTINLGQRLKAHRWQGRVEVLEIVYKGDADAIEKRWIEQYAAMNAPLKNISLMPALARADKGAKQQKEIVSGTGAIEHSTGLISVVEAAERAGMSEGGIRKAISRGRLPMEIVNGRQMLRIGIVDGYRENTQKGSRFPPAYRRREGTKRRTFVGGTDALEDLCHSLRCNVIQEAPRG